jgi:hypothetical protein
MRFDELNDLRAEDERISSYKYFYNIFKRGYCRHICEKWPDLFIVAFFLNFFCPSKQRRIERSHACCGKFLLIRVFAFYVFLNIFLPFFL